MSFEMIRQLVLAYGPYVLIASTCIFAYLWDKQKARYLRHQVFMEMYLNKARMDRNDKVRIPADQVAALFELEHVRRIPAIVPRSPAKQPRHPALQPPGRGTG
jgi:hypothetical protein